MSRIGERRGQAGAEKPALSTPKRIRQNRWDQRLEVARAKREKVLAKRAEDPTVSTGLKVQDGPPPSGTDGRANEELPDILARAAAASTEPQLADEKAGQKHAGKTPPRVLAASAADVGPDVANANPQTARAKLAVIPGGAAAKAAERSLIDPAPLLDDARGNTASDTAQPAKRRKRPALLLVAGFAAGGIAALGIYAAMSRPDLPPEPEVIASEQPVIEPFDTVIAEIGFVPRISDVTPVQPVAPAVVPLNVEGVATTIPGTWPVTKDQVAAAALGSPSFTEQFVLPPAVASVSPKQPDVRSPLSSGIADVEGIGRLEADHVLASAAKVAPLKTPLFQAVGVRSAIQSNDPMQPALRLASTEAALPDLVGTSRPADVTAQPLRTVVVLPIAQVETSVTTEPATLRPRVVLAVSDIRVPTPADLKFVVPTKGDRPVRSATPSRRLPIPAQYAFSRPVEAALQVGHLAPGIWSSGADSGPQVRLAAVSHQPVNRSQSPSVTMASKGQPASLAIASAPASISAVAYSATDFLISARFEPLPTSGDLEGPSVAFSAPRVVPVPAELDVPSDQLPPAPQGATQPPKRLLPRKDEVVVHVLVPGGADEAQATAIKEVLAGIGYVMREPAPVEIKISRPQIRYYHDADAAAAGLVGASLDVAVRNFTNFSPLPAEGTIEVWLEGDAGEIAPKRVTRRTVARVAPPPQPELQGYCFRGDPSDPSAPRAPIYEGQCKWN